MDFFDVFPDLRQEQDVSLKDRSLRLIALSGFPYDDAAFYFEVSQSRYWTRMPDGSPVMGLGSTQAKLTTPKPPLKILFRHIRNAWLSEPEFVPGGYITLVDGDRRAVLSSDAASYQGMPHVLLLTPPRLGGADVPDALVQAVYFLKLRKQPYPSQSPGILKIARDALGEFLAPERWALADLLEQPWAELIAPDPLPAGGFLRPVLALRALRRLWQEGLFSEDMTSC